jgi:phage tail-like protein
VDQQPIRYMILRDRQWDSSIARSGLRVEEDGVLSLTLLPGPAEGKTITIPGPFDADPSGLAIGTCNDLVLSDRANHQVIWRDGVCPERMMQLGNGAGNALSQFTSPCGLLIHSDSLYVADSANSRVQIFRFPTLELRAIWSGMFTQPTGLAVDTKGNIYVLDRGLERVFRFTATGLIDTTYNPSNLKKPVFLAIDGEDRLYVSDAKANQVLRFESDGTSLGALSLPSASIYPRALAARGDRVYVADADSGQIWAFDAASSVWLGAIQGYRGPVSAMAIGPDDSLWIKPALDQVYYRFEPRKVFVAEGLLTTSEPLDAGEDSDWARVHVTAEVPPGTAVQLKLVTGESLPAEAEWDAAQTLPLDALVSPLPGSNGTFAGARRFLWIRVIVTTEEGSVSPRIFQVEAETTSPSYLDYLPEVYRRKDAPTRFLERWLKLVQGEIDDWEWKLEDVPRRFDPLATPEDQLSWLAKWLAFPLPSGLAANVLRPIFAKIPELYTCRGTPSGIRDLAKLYTGESPHLFEGFHTRRVWQLGVTSGLGLDTTLPSALLDGMVVPGWSLADPELMGLRGDYYEGVNFERLRATRDDAQVDFTLVTAPDPLSASRNLSVRWSGQLQPHSTDLYTISTESTGGVRLWVDGRLIIDNWKQPRQQDSGRIALTEGRWYPIVLEYFSETGGSARLSWSSRNQPKEIIPQERLYRVRDEFATLGGPAPIGDSCPVLVGQTVVGESEPLSTAEYGAPLYNETAHLFTVAVPAASLPNAAQRELLRTVIEREKPAHSDYHLCFVDARMRVGFQARIGVDSIIAGPPEPLSLQGTILGFESYLGDDDTQGRIGRVGSHGHIGFDTVLG